MDNIIQSFHHTRCIFYVLIYAKTNFYYIYEKVDTIKFWKLVTIFKLSTLT